MTDMELETDLAERIREAWNTPPWKCNLDNAQQAVMTRIAAKTALDLDRADLSSTQGDGSDRQKET